MRALSPRRRPDRGSDATLVQDCVAGDGPWARPALVD
jgi:hypothetical protein